MFCIYYKIYLIYKQRIFLKYIHACECVFIYIYTVYTYIYIYIYIYIHILCKQKHILAAINCLRALLKTIKQEKGLGKKVMFAVCVSECVCV